MCASTRSSQRDTHSCTSTHHRVACIMHGRMFNQAGGTPPSPHESLKACRHRQRPSSASSDRPSQHCAPTADGSRRRSAMYAFWCRAVKPSQLHLGKPAACRGRCSPAVSSRWRSLKAELSEKVLVFSSNPTTATRPPASSPVAEQNACSSAPCE